MNRSFRFLYSLNILKRDHSYQYHYFDKHFISEGSYVLDIGANLGYYTYVFSRLVGKTGKVYAVEPVSIFFDILKWGTRGRKNIEYLNYALGAEEKEIRMGTPGKFGYLRTGLPQVMDSNNPTGDYEFTFTAQMKRGSLLFKDIRKVDFIKCDIEGYEDVVLPEMRDLLVKFKPIIQLETWGDHKPKVERFLLDIGYEIYNLDHDVLKPISEIKSEKFSDLIFIHKENNGILQTLKASGHA